MYKHMYMYVAILKHFFVSEDIFYSKWFVWEYTITCICMLQYRLTKSWADLLLKQHLNKLPCVFSSSLIITCEMDW